MAETTLDVAEMSCGGCVRSVTKIISRTTGAAEDDVHVDLDSGVATFPEVADDMLQKLLQKLEKQGFPASTR